MKWRRRYRTILIEVRAQLTSGDQNFPQICGLIRALRRASPEYFDREAIRNTREDARMVTGAIDRLVGALSSTTLAPELRLRLALDAVADDIALNSPTTRLLLALKEVRELCQAGSDNQPSADQVRIWCARIAYILMYRFSEEDPSSGSPLSSYRIIATLLYEILTGERDRDLKRACDDHLRGMKAAKKS